MTVGGGEVSSRTDPVTDLRVSGRKSSVEIQQHRQKEKLKHHAEIRKLS